MALSPYSETTILVAASLLSPRNPPTGPVPGWLALAAHPGGRQGEKETGNNKKQKHAMNIVKIVVLAAVETANRKIGM